ESARAVYIQAQLSGKTVARRPLEFGVLQETTLEDFRRGLAAFELKNLSPSLMPVGVLQEYYDSFWQRENSLQERGADSPGRGWRFASVESVAAHPAKRRAIRFSSDRRAAPSLPPGRRGRHGRRSRAAPPCGSPARAGCSPKGRECSHRTGPATRRHPSPR